jgi:hypothetical protein
MRSSKGFRRALLCLILVVVAACSMPDKAAMEGKPPLKIDKGSPGGPNLGCALAMTEESFTAIATIDDALRDDEAGRRQWVTTWFMDHPGAVTIWTMNDLAVGSQHAKSRKYLGYGLANGLGILSTYLGCKDTLRQGGLYYWCGDVERPFPLGTAAADDPNQVAMFYESGWYICRNGGATNLFITGPAAVEQVPEETTLPQPSS